VVYPAVFNGSDTLGVDEMKEEMDPPKDVCPYCGVSRPWSLWALAHWDETLVGKCDSCKKDYEVRRGIAIKFKKGIRKIR
jgi:hypothetical protein